MGYPRPFTTLDLRMNISEPMASQPAHCVLYMTLFWLVVCLINTCYEYIHVMYVNIISKKLFKMLKWIWSTRLSSPLIMDSFMRWIHFTCFVKIILEEHWYLKHSIFLIPIKDIAYQMPLSYNMLHLCTGGKWEILGCVQSAVAGESCTVTSSAYRSLLLASGTGSIFRITCASNPCQLATGNATASTATLSGCLVRGRRWITIITSIL